MRRPLAYLVVFVAAIAAGEAAYWGIGSAWGQYPFGPDTRDFCGLGPPSSHCVGGPADLAWLNALAVAVFVLVLVAGYLFVRKPWRIDR
jgi:hypothetical protein